MSNELLSGQHYSMGTFFSGTRKLVIPDMQREYCWASSPGTLPPRTIVEEFIDSITELSIRNQPVTMGLLYAYEHPKHSGLMQLCDGQQRLTTLFLLLGILYRKTKMDAIHPLLVLTSGDPRLQYSVRESTLFFLYDLVLYYFLNHIDEGEAACGEGSAEIRKQTWFFEEYNLDPSIKDMLKAIDFIEHHLKMQANDNFENLISFIIDKIQFFFFDMGDRDHGEKQFVVLNTTGKPLTATENLKPIFLGGLNNHAVFCDNKTELKYYADLWEKWEHFFWQNREEGTATSDNGLRDFFAWVFIIEKSQEITAPSKDSDHYSEPQQTLMGKNFNLLSISDIANEDQRKRATLDIIERYFLVLQKLLSAPSLIKAVFTQRYKVKNRDVNRFVLLALVTYIQEFNISDLNDRNLLRVAQFFLSRSQTVNVGKSITPMTVEAIKIIKLMKENGYADISCLVKHQDVISKTLLDPGEIFKFTVYRQDPDKRIDYETAFWAAEQLNCSGGDINYIFELMETDFSCSVMPDLDKFNRIVNVLKETLNNPSDVLRRAMLCIGDYSYHVGSTFSGTAERWSLGLKADDYRDLFQNERYRDQKAVLFSFLNKLLSGVCLQEIISEFTLPEKASNWEKVRFEIIKDEKYLKYMTAKQFSWITEEHDIFAMEKTSARSYSKKIPWQEEMVL